MKPRRLLLACCAISLVCSAQGVSWRLFAGREECISEWIPDYQWDIIKDKPAHEDHTQALIDLGFVVTSRYGTEEHKAAVDFSIISPTGEKVHHEAGVSDTEVAVTAEGGQGPWKACFKVTRTQILRPSVLVKISYFTANQMSLVGTNFEWQRDNPGASALTNVDPKALGTVEQVRELTEGLRRLEYYLANVTHEQRYLHSRTARHLRTAESTHSRALGYSLLIYGVVVLAAGVQVLGVRLMFSRSRKQGLII